jgi:hypothetical protein
MSELSGNVALWRCDNCGAITREEISNLGSLPRFGWGCDACHKGKRLFVRRLVVADFNSFGICQRVCDLHPESGYCTEPLQCGEWVGFWELVEREWAEQFKRTVDYDWEDPDYATCPRCGSVGSCMCDMIAEDERDPEGLGLDCGVDDY